MTETIIFMFGSIVVLIISSTLGLLIYGAHEDGQQQQRVIANFGHETAILSALQINDELQREAPDAMAAEEQSGLPPQDVAVAKEEADRVEALEEEMEEELEEEIEEWTVS